MKQKTMRYRYMVKFIIRCAIMVAVFVLYFIKSECFEVMEGMNFFKKFSVLHILWVLWMLDMIQQLIPARNVVSLGSQKLFLMHFKPSHLKKTAEELMGFIRYSHYVNLKVAILWLALVFAVFGIKHTGLIGNRELFLFVTFFYVADLICVLFWCPFRVFLMKNRCCATCTIFNWDHIMMFSPAPFMGGFFMWSLFAMSAIVFIVWEVYLFLYPERFWEETNEALKCTNCEEHLCGKNMHAAGMSNDLENLVLDKVEDITIERVNEIKRK